MNEDKIQKLLQGIEEKLRRLPLRDDFTGKITVELNLATGGLSGPAQVTMKV